MGARRRGAHRPSQKSKDKASRAPSEDGVAGQAEVAVQPTRGGRASQGIKPDAAEVLAAIESLYVDQLKPFGRILRKRIAERHVAEESGSEQDVLEARAGDAYEALPDVDIKHLREVCEDSELIHVAPEEGGDWSATITGRTQSFVDIYTPQDVYPAHMWADAAAYFQGAGGKDMQLPGGRYSCAQALVNRRLPFLADYSLGQVCHVVQLAISQKKILGYFNGSVVPYNDSQTMKKEQCAVMQQPCGSSLESGSTTATTLPLATWETARSCLRDILDGAAAAAPDQGPAMVPLSNVKRLFRSKYNTELSETMLGHSKLSELLQDDRFGDICTVQLQGHGYIVVQTTEPLLPARSTISLADSLLPALGGACFEPLQLDPEPLLQEPRRVAFCPDEPLDFQDAGLLLEGEPSSLPPLPTPLASPGAPTPNTIKRWHGSALAAGSAMASAFAWAPVHGQMPLLRAMS